MFSSVITVSADPGPDQVSGQANEVSAEVAKIQDSKARDEFEAYARKLWAERQVNQDSAIASGENSIRKEQQKAYDSMLRSKGLPTKSAKELMIRPTYSDSMYIQPGNKY